MLFTIVIIALAISCQVYIAVDRAHMDRLRAANNESIRNELASLVAEYGESIKDTPSYRYAKEHGLTE